LDSSQMLFCYKIVAEIGNESFVFFWTRGIAHEYEHAGQVIYNFV